MPHLILPLAGRCHLPRPTISTPLARASFTRDSPRPQVWTVDNRGFSSEKNLTSFHVLFGAISLECVGVPGQKFWPGCWLDACWHYTHIPWATATRPSLQEGGGPEIPTLVSSHAHLPSSQKEFLCQSLEISPGFITWLNLIFLMICRSSDLPAQISKNQFYWSGSPPILAKPSFLGPHDSHGF